MNESKGELAIVKADEKGLGTFRQESTALESRCIQSLCALENHRVEFTEVLEEIEQDARGALERLKGYRDGRRDFFKEQFGE